MNSPKGLRFKKESQEEVQKRYMKNERHYKQGLELGIDFLKFDGDEYDSRIFKSQADYNKYLADTALAAALIVEDKNIPLDLRNRLIKIKELKEKLK